MFFSNVSGPVPTGLNFDEVLHRQLTATGGPRVSDCFIIIKIHIASN